MFLFDERLLQMKNWTEPPLKPQNPNKIQYTNDSTILLLIWRESFFTCLFLQKLCGFLLMFSIGCFTSSKIFFLDSLLITEGGPFLCQCRTQSISGDTVYSCYCKLRLLNPPWWGLRGRKLLILITLDHWKRHFRENNYIEIYFYLLKSTKSTKATSQRCWRNVIWADFFFGAPTAQTVSKHVWVRRCLCQVFHALPSDI